MIRTLRVPQADENHWLENISTRIDSAYAMLPPPEYPMELERPIGEYPEIVEMWDQKLRALGWEVSRDN